VATEEVVLLGSSDIPAENKLRDALSRRGFYTAIVTPDTASIDDGVDGVPMLRINAPDGHNDFAVVTGTRARPLGYTSTWQFFLTLWPPDRFPVPMFMAAPPVGGSDRCSIRCHSDHYPFRKLDETK